MVSRYKKRAQTRLCDGETRLVPGSENESTDILFEKTRRERVRTLLLLFFMKHTCAFFFAFFLSREEETLRKKKNGEKTRAARERRKKTASLSLFSRKNQKRFCAFLRAKTRSNGRVVRNEMVWCSQLCVKVRVIV